MVECNGRSLRGAMGEVGVQTSDKRELALSGLTLQLNRLSTYLHCGKCTLLQQLYQ